VDAELLAARAKAYNMTVEQYKKKNLLRTEVASRDVAELAAEMCGPLFAKTTAAQVPIDGGNDRSCDGSRADPLEGRPPRAPRPAPASPTRRSTSPAAPPRTWQQRSATWW
jgi:hypothetical protein